MKRLRFPMVVNKSIYGGNKKTSELGYGDILEMNLTFICHDCTGQNVSSKLQIQERNSPQSAADPINSPWI